jgi:hypothetical protein
MSAKPLSTTASICKRLAWDLEDDITDGMAALLSRMPHSCAMDAAVDGLSPAAVPPILKPSGLPKSKGTLTLLKAGKTLK